MYEPLQPLISFVKDEPRKAWVTSPIVYERFQMTLYDKPMLLISHDYNEAEQGLGSFADERKVKPFTDDLWVACEAWLQRKAQLAIDLESLKRKKLPTAKGQAPWQDLLLFDEVMNA